MHKQTTGRQMLIIDSSTLNLKSAFPFGTAPAYSDA